jgi:RHS repeat-associated protein
MLQHKAIVLSVQRWAGYGSRTTNQKYSSSTDDTRMKFATYQRDWETGLDFAQSRYYSPRHGRFTSPDEFKGGPDELFDFEEDASDNPTFYADLTNPQSLNKYQYTYNNPYKFNDPNGHCPPIICIPAGVVYFIHTLATPTGQREQKTNFEAALDVLDALPGGKAGGILSGIILKGAGKAAKQPLKKVGKLSAEKTANFEKAAQQGIPKNMLGGSGKPRIHTKKLPTDKKAKDYTRNRGQGPPVNIIILRLEKRITILRIRKVTKKAVKIIFTSKLNRKGEVNYRTDEKIQGKENNLDRLG